MSNLFSAPQKFNICRHVFNNAPSTYIIIFIVHNVIIVSETGTSVAAVNVWSKIGKWMFVVGFVHQSIMFHIVFQEL